MFGRHRMAKGVQGDLHKVHILIMKYKQLWFQMRFVVIQ